MLQRALIFLALMVLVACSGPRLPFEKDLPADNQIVTPPWEAFVKAGPNAEKELDMETLDGPNALPPPLIAEAEAAGQDDAKLEPTTPKPKKTGMVIRSVAVPTVQGAKGKGNAELTAAMRQVLRQAGWSVVDLPAADALTIRGRVKVAAAKGPLQKVSLSWSVTTPDGKLLGDVNQANDVPSGSIEQGWGENARFATEAAAEGIFKLIQKHR